MVSFIGVHSPNQSQRNVTSMAQLSLRRFEDSKIAEMLEVFYTQSLDVMHIPTSQKVLTRLNRSIKRTEAAMDTV